MKIKLYDLEVEVPEYPRIVIPMSYRDDIPRGLPLLDADLLKDIVKPEVIDFIKAQTVVEWISLCHDSLGVLVSFKLLESGLAGVDVVFHWYEYNNPLYNKDDYHSHGDLTLVTDYSGITIPSSTFGVAVAKAFAEITKLGRFISGVVKIGYGRKHEGKEAK